MANLLYQRGVADNVILNAIVQGTATDQTLKMEFVEPLNFTDSTIKLSKGWVTLHSHSVSGPAKMTIVYSLRGMEKSDPKTLVGTVPQIPGEEAVEEAGEDDEGEFFETMSERDIRPRSLEILSDEERGENFFVPMPDIDLDTPLPKRTRRMNPKLAATTKGSLPKGVFLKDWLEAINKTLNKE